ncbi:MAG TPA: alpha/beta fold hydrolase [Myxococcota bacterium]|nr:alpha/beta fold hydrolase [Myxococcota bacterium]HRY94529.1 alpha/beta fold hydrolase [Myxococcota bacterium]HSA20028.1 alpha/beta fold hydrolase [Myxococcota bacterium]
MPQTAPTAPPGCASRFVEVLGHRLHCLEAGAGGPPVLFLHGIPTHAGLWRNVLPWVAPRARCVALDLLGFGQSDKPLDVEYGLTTQARHVAGAVEALGLAGALVVGMDLGLLVGLRYAREHEADVRGLVLLEGFIQPMAQAYRALPLASRVPLALSRPRWLAELMIVRGGTRVVERMLTGGTLRRYTPEELEAYRAPLRDPAVRRKVWLEGAGPRSIRPVSRAPGDLVEQIDQGATWLRGSSLPKLLLHGEPGMAVSAPTLTYAREHLTALEIESVGPGKHFLPEDQPEAIGRAIAGFHARLPGPGASSAS